MMSEVNRRWEVYELLRESNLSQRDLVKDWKISKQAVSSAVHWLLRAGALAEVPGCGTPKRYQRGPLAERYEDAVKSGATPRAGRLTESSQTVGVEVHRGGVRVKVLGGPGKPVPWAKEWVASGQKFAHLWHMFGAERYYFKLSAGRTSSTLEVYPPRKWAWSSFDIEKVAASRKRQTVLAIRAFAREFQFELHGPIERHVPDEFAMEVPGIPPFNDPRTDDAWGDESKGAGRVEFETRKPAIAKRFMRLDLWSDEVDEQLKAIRAHISDEKDRWQQLVKLLEEEATMRGVALSATLQEVLNRQNGGQHA